MSNFITGFRHDFSSLWLWVEHGVVHGCLAVNKDNVNFCLYVFVRRMKWPPVVTWRDGRNKTIISLKAPMQSTATCWLKIQTWLAVRLVLTGGSKCRPRKSADRSENEQCVLLKLEVLVNFCSHKQALLVTWNVVAVVRSFSCNLPVRVAMSGLHRWACHGGVCEWLSIRVSR